MHFFLTAESEVILQLLASEMLNLFPCVHSRSKNAGPPKASVFLFKPLSAAFPRLCTFHFLLSTILAMPFNPEDLSVWNGNLDT